MAGYKKYRKGGRKYRRGKARRYFKKKAKSGAWGTIGTVAYKAFKIARRIADAVNIEYHHYDSTSTPAAVDYNGGLTTLNGVSQGSTDQTRVGDSMKCQNLILRYLAAYTSTACTLRCIIFWDEQNQITSTSQLLESVGSSLAVLSPKNYDLRFRTKILHDSYHVLDASNTQSIRDLTIPLNMHTQFSAGSTTINTGALKMLLIASINNAVGGLPTFAYYSRLTFTDN